MAVNLEHLTSNGNKDFKGLITDQIYSITKVATIKVNGGSVNLISLHNPCGRGEYTSNWSDNSVRWSFLSHPQKKLLEFTPEDDGEIRMDYKHFLYFFTELEIVQLSAASHLNLPRSQSCWLQCYHHRKWKVNASAGGNSTTQLHKH